MREKLQPRDGRCGADIAEAQRIGDIAIEQQHDGERGQHLHRHVERPAHTYQQFVAPGRTAADRFGLPLHRQ